MSSSPPPSTTRMRLRVDIGKDPTSSRRLLVPVDGSSTVAELTRAVEEREHKRRKITGEAQLKIADIQLRVRDGLCEVDPDDILSDLVPNDGQDSVFVAIYGDRNAALDMDGYQSSFAAGRDGSAGPFSNVGANCLSPSSPSDGHRAIADGGSSDTGSGGGGGGGGSASSGGMVDGRGRDVKMVVGGAVRATSSYSSSPSSLAPMETTSTVPTPARPNLAPIAPLVTPALSVHRKAQAVANAASAAAAAAAAAGGGGREGGSHGGESGVSGSLPGIIASHGAVPAVPGFGGARTSPKARPTGMIASLMMGGDPRAMAVASSKVGVSAADVAAAAVAAAADSAPARAAAAAATAEKQRPAVVASTSSIVPSQGGGSHNTRRPMKRAWLTCAPDVLGSMPTSSPAFTIPTSPWSAATSRPSQTVAERAAAASRMQQQHWHRVAAHEQPTEAEAATAARAAAAAMAAAKVQVLGPPWQGEAACIRRRPSDHRAAAAAAAALAGLGGGQWGGATTQQQQQQVQQVHLPAVSSTATGQNCPTGTGGTAAQPVAIATPAPPVGKPVTGKSRTPAEKMMAAAAVMEASVAVEAANVAAAAAAAVKAESASAENGGGAGDGHTEDPQRQETTVDVGCPTTMTSAFQPPSMSSSGVAVIAGSSATSSGPNSAPVSCVTATLGSTHAGGGGGDSVGTRFQPPVRQWQAAEKLVLTAFQLQVSEPPDQQEEAKVFLTKIAKDAGEPPGPVIALVRAVVQPAPWGSGYLVASRRQLTNLCQSNGTPTGFDCLTRYLLGNRYPQSGGSNRVDTPRVRKCFSALAAQVGNHPDRGQLDYHALGVGRCVFTLRKARVAALAANAAAAAAASAATAGLPAPPIVHHDPIRPAGGAGVDDHVDVVEVGGRGARTSIPLTDGDMVGPAAGVAAAAAAAVAAASAVAAAAAAASTGSNSSACGSSLPLAPAAALSQAQAHMTTAATATSGSARSASPKPSVPRESAATLPPTTTSSSKATTVPSNGSSPSPAPATTEVTAPASGKYGSDRSQPTAESKAVGSCSSVGPRTTSNGTPLMPGFGGSGVGGKGSGSGGGGSNITLSTARAGKCDNDASVKT